METQTRVVNAKGEFFDTTGATYIDLTPFEEKRYRSVWHWSGYEIQWKGEAYYYKLPIGKIILPIDFPHAEWQKKLIKRFHSNDELFLKEVGFIVNDQSLPFHNSFWGPELKDWEEKKAHRRARASIEKKVKNNTANWTQPARLLIPEIGTILRLENDWTFDLHSERRNTGLINLIGETFKSDWDWEQMGKKVPGPWKVTIRKGSLLTMDRLYVRKGAEKFSSLSFILRADGEPTISFDGKDFSCKGKKNFQHFGITGVLRFWAKLADVNTLIVSAMEETIKVSESLDK